MASLYVIANGVEYCLSDGSLCYKRGEDGTGMAPVERIRERGPLQHGDTDRGFRLRPRVITLTLEVVGETLADRQARKNTLLSIFRPTESPVSLRWELDDGTKRQIDAFYAGGMSMGSENRGGTRQLVAIALDCPDPAFYDPASTTVNFGVSISGGSLTVPLEVPLNVGSSEVNHTQTIRYTGTWREYPVITIQGPITAPKIENLSTGEVLEFSPETVIAAGEQWTIDTRYGRKTITASDGTSKLSTLTDESDLASFHLADASGVPGGDNDIRVTGTAGDAGTQVFLRYYRRYIGI